MCYEPLTDYYLSSAHLLPELIPPPTAVEQITAPFLFCFKYILHRWIVVKAQVFSLSSVTFSLCKIRRVATSSKVCRTLQKVRSSCWSGVACQASNVLPAEREAWWRLVRFLSPLFGTRSDLTSPVTHSRQLQLSGRYSCFHYDIYFEKYERFTCN